MESLYVLLSIKLFLCSIGILLHGVGIYALSKSKRLRTDEVRILVSLSMSELIMLVKMTSDAIVGYQLYQDQHYGESPSFPEFLKQVLNDGIKYKTVLFLKNVGIGMIVANLMLLSMNRFVHTMLPLRYAASAQDKSIFQKLIYSLWIIIPSICLLVIKNEKIVMFFSIGLTLLTIIVISVCYVLIAIKVRSARRTLIAAGWVSNQNAERQRQWKKQMVPLLIIVTFFLFYLIPYTTQVFSFNVNKGAFTHEKHLFVEGLSCVEVVGFISDAVIYIFFTKKSGDTVKNLFCCSTKCDVRASTTR